MNDIRKCIILNNNILFSENIRRLSENVRCKNLVILGLVEKRETRIFDISMDLFRIIKQQPSHFDSNFK